MAKEILELQVNSNIKGVVTDVDALATSVEKAYDAEAELSKNIELQNQFIADQEVELARLKATQDSIPKGSWYGGQSKLTADIKKVTSTLRTEKAALKKLTTEQKKNTRAVRSASIAQKKNNNAAIRGIQHFQIMGVSIRKLKFMVRGVVPMFKLLFGTIRTGIQSTGIGIIILAIISIGVSMKKTAKGGKMLKLMMAAIGKVVNILLTPFKLLGDAIATLFGIEADSKTLSAMEIMESKLVKIQKALDDINIREAEQGVELGKNRRIVDDTTKSELKRLAALREINLTTRENNFDTLIELEKEKKIRDTILHKAKGWVLDHKRRQVADEESEKSAKNLKKRQEEYNETIIALANLKVKMQTDDFAFEDDYADIQSFNIDKIAKEREVAQDKRNKAADAWRKTQKEIAADELSIAKQLEKIKNELYYRTLETTQDVEEAKLQDAKEAADHAILISTASKEVKDAALLVLEEKYQSDLAIIQKKYSDKAKKEDDADWDKKIADNDAWNVKQLADQEIADAKKKKIDDIYEKEKQKSISMGFDAASSLAKEGSVIAKGIAVARTVYNTQQAIMNAMATVPAPWNIAQSIATGVMGAASIQKILSTNPEGGGGDVDASVSAVPPAPEMMSGAFTLSGGQEVEPARAYVVSDDITNNQNKLAIIRRRATI